MQQRDRQDDEQGELLAYLGRYELDVQNGVVRHLLEGDLFPGSYPEHPWKGSTTFSTTCCRSNHWMAPIGEIQTGVGMLGRNCAHEPIFVWGSVLVTDRDDKFYACREVRCGRAGIS